MPSDPRPGPGDLFQCRMCGDCCKGFGGTYVGPEEIRAIAGFIGDDDPDGFAARYCRMSGSRPVLVQGGDGYCIFYRDGCAIHPVKPRMCRAWPFIPAVLTDVGNWHAMAGSCPGMRTDLPDAVIREIVRRVLHGEAGAAGGSPPSFPAHS